MDDNSRYTWLYPIKRKYELLEIFLKFQKIVAKQFSRSIKIFHCDGGGEFINNEFIKHLENHGVIR